MSLNCSECCISEGCNCAVTCSTEAIKQLDSSMGCGSGIGFFLIALLLGVSMLFVVLIWKLAKQKREDYTK